jgi:multimeric flavodoxin WrbA
MHVLMINTSPHRQGCTNRALLEIAATLDKKGISSEILWIGTEALHGCIDCGYCFNHGKCVFGDDKVNEAAEKAIASDALILGAPVHYASIAGSGSAFLDRLFRVVSRQMSFKPGASVVSCRRGGASASFDQLNKYFTISGMPVVSSTYWNSVHGNTVEEVEQDLEGLQVMRNLGSTLAWLLASIEAGNVQRPRLEREHYTNFIR